VTDTFTPAARARYQLPPEAYHSREWYEREQTDLFARTWNLVAYEADIEGSGGSLPVDIGPEPVLLVRDGDGVLRGFLNMCRHRGMALQCGPGRVDGAIRCPYHGWEYSLDGDLTRIPQRAAQFGDIDPARWGLLPVAVDTWHGMVFVHPDPAASPLREWLGDLPERVGPFDPDRLEEVCRLRVPVAANWKLYIENHIDVLHLWYLHDRSLDAYDHTGFLHGKLGPHWVSEERLRPGGDDPDREWGSLPSISHLPSGERDVLRANLIFPNVPMASTDAMFLTYQVLPTGPTTCELDLRVRGEPGAALDAEGLARLLRVVRDEDGTAVEQIQRVVRSSRFEVGPLAAAHEAPIAAFHQDLLRYLT
jgi:choline monooxygenase